MIVWNSITIFDPLSICHLREWSVMGCLSPFVVLKRYFGLLAFVFCLDAQGIYMWDSG